jgi:hypothetical protein
VSSVASASFYDAAGSLSYGMIRILSGPQTDESIEKCGVSCRGFLNSRSLSPPRAGFNIQILAGTYSQVPHCSEYPTLPYALQIDGKLTLRLQPSRIAVAAKAAVAQPLLLTLLGFKAAPAV